MAEASQFSFSMKDLTIALIKQQNLHDGNWIVGFEFSLAAGNMGLSPTDVKPTAIVGISNVTLQRVREGDPSLPFQLPFQVNAAEVNPAS